MTTTQSRFGRFTVFVCLAILAFSVTATFARPKNSSDNEIRSFHLVGHVEQVNKDHTFDFVSSSGQHYRVRMTNDAAVNAYMGFPGEKSMLSFEDLYKGARITSVANASDEAYTTTNPMPVAVR